MREPDVQKIRERHDDFEARYSPGPDWEPFNQTHRDRGALLDALAAAEARVAEVERDKAHLARQFDLALDAWGKDQAALAAARALEDAETALGSLNQIIGCCDMSGSVCSAHKVIYGYFDRKKQRALAPGAAGGERAARPATTAFTGAGAADEIESVLRAGNHLANALIMLAGTAYPPFTATTDEGRKWFHANIKAQWVTAYDVWIGWRAAMRLSLALPFTADLAPAAPPEGQGAQG